MEAFRALSRINSISFATERLFFMAVSLTQAYKSFGTRIVKRVLLRIVKELNEFLEAEAKRLGLSKHGLILKILWEYKGGAENERR